MVLAPSGTRPDLAGLWIDYVLLPERLDEHLAALSSGTASSPSHSELLNMLLEQALSNYKHGKKEAEPPFKPSSGKTAAVLCERAVRVAVAAEMTLEDVEVMVARQVQSLLLKALVKYDKPRSLVHEYNYHRWVIRKALVPGTGAFGGAAVRAASAGDEASGILQDSVPAAESVESQEDASISFLEAALHKLPNERQSKQNGEAKKQTITNGQMNYNNDYLCQLMFDLAEAHFMRSRLKRASELFSRCGQLVPGLVNPSAVPQDRLNGFIAACRAFDTSHAIPDAKGSVGQEALLACERGRHSLKRKQHPISYGDCNGESQKKVGNKFGKQNGIGPDHEKHSGLNGFELKTSKLERSGSVSEGKDIVDVVAGDLLTRRLSWGYCQSLATDPALPQAVRCKLAVCNALRHILEGGAFETISGVMEGFEEKEVAEFLFQLLRKMVDGGQVDAKQVLLLRQFCIYACCMFEESWCWDFAMQQGLLSQEDRLQLKAQANTELQVVGVPTSDRVDTGAVLDVLQANSFSSFENVMSAATRQPHEIMARVLRMRALDAIESGEAHKLDRDFLGLASQLAPKEVDTQLFLWFLDRQRQGNSSLPEKAATAGMLEYVAVKLIDAEDWTALKELSQLSGHSERKQQSMLLEEAGMLSQLLGFSVEFEQAITRRDNIGEKFPGLEAGLWQAFEDFMSLFFGMAEQGQELQLGLGSFPIISRISSVKVLERLASLAAGWLNRCHEDAAFLEVARYGALAELTSITGPRHTYKKAAVESGKSLFSLLVKRLLRFVKFPQGDSTKCSKWLLSLADLAFIEQSHLKALQLYLQAGALRSSFFCDRLSSMARDLYTPWVVTRMITSCQEIGARLQAIVLCQCLPEPDYELVFKILQDNPLIVDRDADYYFECIWEIPILEFLVNMHAKAGDRARVNTLISLLQQPALNVHNPASVRRAHVLGMEQRFLQRFYAELLG